MIDQITRVFLEYPILYSIGFIVLVVFIHDIFIQKRFPILHNFPLVGHFRYLLMSVGPELRQYIVANDKEEMPFNRGERDWIYRSSHKLNNTFGFGTNEILYNIGYPIIKNTAIPYPQNKATYFGEDPTVIPCLKIMGQSHGRKKPYRPASIINISAMSYGSLGKKATGALNLGAKMAGCYHNTGEGSISMYHESGADLMWQIGTGYYGCRDSAGYFSKEMFMGKIRKYPQIKCVEIKLSQGAKPGKGGILPGTKVTAEIAAVRGIPEGKDCISPNFHSAFSSVDQMIDFIEEIATLSGLPVGIKAAIGHTTFWEELAVKMKTRNEGPDFITIDGGEGGTGAAPLTFADHVSLPFKVAFTRIYKIFLEQNIVDDIVWIGSGKLGFPDRAMVASAFGVDIIQIARESMISIGCIQAQKCHTGHCPAGIATQNSWLEAGLNVEKQAEHFSNYVKSFRKELLELAWAAGYQHPSQITGKDIEFSTGVNKFSNLSEVMGYEKRTVDFTTLKDYCPL